jgi:hypothetical protein
MALNKDMLSIYENFELDRRMGWPVVVAERKGKIIGFLGTQDRKEMVVAGPLEVAIKNKGFVVMRLIEAYDNLMRSLGMKEYWFSVDAKNNVKWEGQVKDSGFCAKIEDIGDESWYKRQL